MTTEQSSLEDLLVDEEGLNKELLAETLRPFTRVGDSSGQLLLQPPYYELTAKEKILVVLLAQKARAYFEFADDEWLSPSEISDLSSVKKGTIYPIVRDLADEGKIDDDDGSYHVPTYNIESIKQQLEDSVPEN